MSGKSVCLKHQLVFDKYADEQNNLCLSERMALISLLPVARMATSFGACLSATCAAAPSNTCEYRTRSLTWSRRRRFNVAKVVAKVEVAAACEVVVLPAEVSQCQTEMIRAPCSFSQYHVRVVSSIMISMQWCTMIIVDSKLF